MPPVPKPSGELLVIDVVRVGPCCHKLVLNRKLTIGSSVTMPAVVLMRQGLDDYWLINLGTGTVQPVKSAVPPKKYQAWVKSIESPEFLQVSDKFTVTGQYITYRGRQSKSYPDTTLCGWKKGRHEAKRPEPEPVEEPTPVPVAAPQPTLTPCQAGPDAGHHTKGSGP